MTFRLPYIEYPGLIPIDCAELSIYQHPLARALRSMVQIVLVQLEVYYALHQWPYKSATHITDSIIIIHNYTAAIAVSFYLTLIGRALTAKQGNKPRFLPLEGQSKDSPEQLKV